ncbi:MAG TPA: FxDxF family PEP-CTERM protein [Steroidobacteraceae bacterium]|nr:FxDxF family PEP-CTERM protein [Steroidobacteraceae bacterium]
MKTLKLFFAAAVALGTLSGAQAATFNLGNVDRETRYFGDTVGKKSSFTEVVKFKLTEQSAVDFAFKSFHDIIKGSLAVQLQEKVSGGWTTIATASPSFADLSAGKYRWEVSGITGRQSGFWGAKMAVTAVPEADVWMMLLIGVGLVGYQLRRKQQSLKHPPLAA